MSNTKTVVIHGIAHYCKLLGPARENNFGEKEWTIDVTPDAEGRKVLKELGLSNRLREPKADDKAGRTESFLTFRQRELKADGTPADPIRVVNAAAEPWTKEMGLIGNESEVNVKFVVRNYGVGKKDGVYLRAMQVTKHVPYESSDFEPVADAEFFALPEGLEPALDDDIPE